MRCNAPAAMIASIAVLAFCSTHVCDKNIILRAAEVGSGGHTACQLSAVLCTRPSSSRTPVACLSLCLAWCLFPSVCDDGHASVGCTCECNASVATIAPIAVPALRFTHVCGRDIHLRAAEVGSGGRPLVNCQLSAELRARPSSHCTLVACVSSRLA